LSKVGPTPDDVLIRRIQNGDQVAFQELFERYVETLTTFARRWLPRNVQRKVSASDVVQEANLTALAKLDGFEHRGENSVRNWLLKIVEFKVREAVRRHAGTAGRAVGREVTRAERPDTQQFARDQDTPSQVAVAGELADFAAAAMRKLPPHYREVLRLVRQQQLSMREIGERIGKSREATKKIHARALAKFTGEFNALRDESVG
jgi:RNA polymerase sigma-70 factor (ECF subfamily)